MGVQDLTSFGLWLAVVASGVYHGLSPSMGWPLAVSAALMEKRPRALADALGWLAAGHLVAMLAALLPFALLVTLIAWQKPIQIAAAVMVAAFGIVQLVRSRHPRLLARIAPHQLALWSFAVAVAHGAGLMLVPIYLGLCRTGDVMAAALLGASLATALLVAFAHTLAMLAAGGLMAWLVYRYFGLKLIAGSWFNLEAVWAASLVVVGAVSLALLLVDVQRV